MGEIRVVEEESQDLPFSNTGISTPEGLDHPFKEDLEKKAVASMFDLGDKDEAYYEDKINDILEYAKTKTEDHSLEGLKWAVRDLELKLNTPAVGEKMIDYLHRFAYLEMEGKRIDKEKAKFL